MSSKSTQKQETKQTQQQGTDPRLDPYFMNLAGQTNQAINTVDRSPWTGPAVAARNQFDAPGMINMEQILSTIGGAINPMTFVNPAIQAASGTLLHPESNPYLQPAIDAMINPVTKRLNQEVLPGIDAAAMFSNAFGGDRAALTRGQAVGDWAEEAGNIQAKTIYSNYLNEQARMDRAPQMFQEGLAASTAVPGMQMALADRERQLAQYEIDDQLMRRMLTEQFAFAGLPQGAQILGSLPYQNSTMTGSTTSTQTQKQNPLTAMLQGGLGAASMMSGLGWSPFASKTVAGVPGNFPTGAANNPGIMRTLVPANIAGLVPKQQYTF